MNLEKIKEVLKSKRTLVISTVLIGALTIAVTGTMMLHNKNTENKKVAVEKQDNEQLENVVEEESEDLTVDNIVEDNEAVENTNEHIHDENCNHDTENSTSQENNQEVVKNNETINKQENTTQNNNDKKVTTTVTEQVNTSNKNTHTHNWVEVYKDVYHAEEGHYENVLVKEAWTESVPIYEEQYRAICNTCGADITGNEGSHIRNHMLNGENGSYKNVPMQVQVGTNTINHDAVYEKKWIVDKQAWTEKVLSGYKCNECGSTK